MRGRGSKNRQEKVNPFPHPSLELVRHYPSTGAKLGQCLSRFVLPLGVWFGRIEKLGVGILFDLCGVDGDTLVNREQLRAKRPMEMDAIGRTMAHRPGLNKVAVKRWGHETERWIPQTVGCNSGRFCNTRFWSDSTIQPVQFRPQVNYLECLISNDAHVGSQRKAKDANLITPSVVDSERGDVAGMLSYAGIHRTGNRLTVWSVIPISHATKTAQKSFLLPAIELARRTRDSQNLSLCDGTLPQRGHNLAVFEKLTGGV